MSRARALARLVAKDFGLELREKSSLWVQTGFTVAAAVLVASAASQSQAPHETIAIGLILVSLFHGLFTGYTVFLKEAYRGTLDGLRMAPVERWLIVVSKLVLATTTILVQLLVFAVAATLFTPGVSVEWASLLSWVGATSLFIGAASSFVSASMAFAEEKSGPLAMIILVLSIPYLRSASAPLSWTLQDLAPGGGELPVLWMISAVFVGIAVGLASIIIE